MWFDRSRSGNRRTDRNPQGCRHELVTRFIPNLSHAEKLDALRAATQHAASLGVTSVQDMSGAGHEAAYRELIRNQELKTRVLHRSPIAELATLRRSRLKAARGDAWMRRVVSRALLTAV